MSYSFGPNVEDPANMEVPPMARTREHVQWAYAKLVAAGASEEILSTDPKYAHISSSFPYTIPTGKWLCITNITFASKFPSSGRASYLVLSNVVTLVDSSPHIVFGDRTPLMVPDLDVNGNPITIQATFFNNELMTPEYGVGSPAGTGGEQQWMNMAMTGYLIDKVEGMTAANALDGLF